MKEKKIVHLETRKMPSGRYQLYLEIESKNSEDWNSIRSIVETLNGIDIQVVKDFTIAKFLFVTKVYFLRRRTCRPDE